MTDAKTKAAQALDPLLSSFRALDDHVLKAVLYEQECDILDSIILQFDELSLSITADGDDEIAFEIARSSDINNSKYQDVSARDPWNRFLGKRFGWGWITINQQGYSDGLLLAFDSIIPSLVLNVAASEIMIGKIEMLSFKQT
jgi:hypothetical protein